MEIIRLDNADLHYGDQPLLDKVTLRIRAGQRIGLLGRNGAGKSTLLKIIEGSISLDSGERWQRSGTSIARLLQELPEGSDESVGEFVAAGIPHAGALLARYEHLISAGAQANLKQLDEVQQALEANDGWALQQRVASTLTRLGLDGAQKMNALSGGWRRRAALARALVGEPDLLLLDEPTNHLDIPTIEWLEMQVKSFAGALLLITHDRRFLQNTVDHIAELERGRLTVWSGDYQGFLRHREQELEAEARAEELFDKRLSEEERWIRQGIKARRTRNEGRVRALEAMRRERLARRKQQGTATLRLDDAQRSGKIVAELEQVAVVRDDKTVLRDLSLLVQRGDRIGIVGPNGAGKSTLLQLITGALTPDTGSVRLGSKLDIAYADQLRGELDPKKNLIDNVCGGQEFVDVGGRRRHAVSYLGDFLFPPQRLRTPVSALSGGERNRAVLAKLFTRPANLLILDEPTNDLDIETLELLEELLLDFAGTVLLVSHDRDFMDKVVTSLLILQGDGQVEEQAGGYSDWEARGGGLATKLALSREEREAPSPAGSGDSTPAQDKAIDGKKEARRTGNGQSEKKSAKLSYQEKRELASLPGEIDTLERRQAELEALSSDPDFYSRDHQEVQETLDELAAIGQRLENILERWTLLEERA